MCKFMSFYDFSIYGFNGELMELNQFVGKKVLLVNVVFECGLIFQYVELVVLWEDYFEDQVVIIGFFCNDFGGQELGIVVEIQLFCDMCFCVNFLLIEKIYVKGLDVYLFY